MSVSQPISDTNINSGDYYRQGDKICEGAYPIVYRGQYRGSSVALKQIKVNSDKILGEIQLMKEHGDKCTKLIKVHAIFTSPRPLTMVMELCERGSLYKVLREETKQSLQWGTKKKIARDIAQGLDYLHSKNIVHGDVKSPNVLITTHYNAKLSDYGLAELKRTSPHTSSRCTLVGSIPWMAPELLTAEGVIPYSHNSDIYSFGLTLYEMTTHTIPFEGTNNALLFNKIINGAPEQIPSDTPGYFRSIIDECRDRNPDSRPTFRVVANRLIN